MHITKNQARNFLLAYQKLFPPRSNRGKEGIIDYMERVRCIQYDPLSVVGYNPHLVLQSRIKNFIPKQLDQLLYKERILIDGWDKNMSIYMTEDWPYFARFREESRKRYENKVDFLEEIAKVREHLTLHGPISSIDIKSDGKMDWAWAPTRIVRAALESMFYTGEVLVHHKVGTRKVFDFTHRLLPEELMEESDPNKELADYIKWHVKRRIQAIGLMWDRSSYAYIAIRWMKSRDRIEALRQLEADGEIIPFTIEDMSYKFYICQEDLPLFQEVMTWSRKPSHMAFIAPLDNLLWDRQLIRELFDFDYKWEVYTPVTERLFGYYVLPILYGNRLIGRFEPKYHRKTGQLEIIGWWWEKEMNPTKGLVSAMTRALDEFLKYLGATHITLDTDDHVVREVISYLNAR